MHALAVISRMTYIIFKNCLEDKINVQNQPSANFLCLSLSYSNDLCVGDVVAQ